MFGINRRPNMNIPLETVLQALTEIEKLVYEEYKIPETRNSGLVVISALRDSFTNPKFWK